MCKNDVADHPKVEVCVSLPPLQKRSICFKKNSSREHLYRRHGQQQSFCPRCATTFEREQDFEAHIRAEKPCKIVKSSDRSSQSISPAQMYRLRRRKGQYNASETKKWFEIWDLLFPDRPRPSSPCKSTATVPDFRTLIVPRSSAEQGLVEADKDLSNYIVSHCKRQMLTHGPPMHLSIIVIISALVSGQGLLMPDRKLQPS